MPLKRIIGMAQYLTVRKAWDILSRWVAKTAYMWKTSMTAPIKKACSGEGSFRLNMMICMAAAKNPAKHVEMLQATVLNAPICQ